jgi:hypothetical protein
MFKVAGGPAYETLLKTLGAVGWMRLGLHFDASGQGKS